MNINPLRKDRTIIIFMIFFVPLAGEISFYPVNETFRVSLGPPALFLFLLFLRKTTIIPGFLIAVLVVFFRVLLDFFMHAEFSWLHSFETHFPTFFFYFTYTCLFYLAKVNRFHHRFLIIGLLGIIIEILSDCAELLIQYIIFGFSITSISLSKLVLIALSHSFIVLGVFSMMKLYEVQSREIEVRKRNEHMLLHVSNLYEETIHLKKTLQNSEAITKKAYELYRGLNQNHNANSRLLKKVRPQLLEIAGEVHDIKKDNQRIFAGLLTLISNEGFTDYINITELIKIIVQANEKYARLLKKDIHFSYTIKGEHPHYHINIILSIINNLVANAVEAIQDRGTIKIEVSYQQNSVDFRIEDDGPGIPEKYRELIFKPGFTSKFDSMGVPSTGIGLTFVKDMITKLNGIVTFQSDSSKKRTVFTICLPVKNLVEKGDFHEFLYNR
ncbi:two-component system, sensor histidine kinase YcbA [Alteribacillus bidgolensis]|uniref:histidine kinase n=1 Tax=Alteribacillus bidgolensis TaxID=930129 RepID=A0A1G8HEM4_9BACI|nr:two-component system, sensor histidine kinase YcbA [Alteribacillus bidgolensis]